MYIYEFTPQSACVLTWHIVSQSVCYGLDCAAHSHLASLQYLLNNELACVTIKTLGGVDVAWITKHV